MIAITTSRQDAHQAANDLFLAMLPRIQGVARRAFGNYALEQREELVAEVVANCYCAFLRMVDRGKTEVAFPTPLANYAIRQVLDGRTVGSKRNIRDVSFTCAQQRANLYGERLDRFDGAQGTWMEVLIEDRQANPADIAASRIDFAAWLRSLPARSRKIDLYLSTGESTGAAAQKFGLSRSRISQMRRELMNTWEAFHTGG